MSRLPVELAPLMRALARQMREHGYEKNYTRAIIEGLDASPAARVARANEQGWTVPGFHARNGDFTAFAEPPNKGFASYFGIPVEVDRHANFAARDAVFANEFAPLIRDSDTIRAGKRPNIMPLRVRPGKELDLSEGRVPTDAEVEALVSQGVDRNWVTNYLGDPSDTWEAFDGPEGKFFTDALRRAGYDSVAFLENDAAGRAATSHAAWQPEAFRSQNAMFNPRRQHKRDILAGTVLAALLSQLRDEEGA